MKKVKPFHVVLFALIILFALIGESLIEWILLNAPDLPLIVISIAPLLLFGKFYIEYHEDKNRSKNK